MTHHEQVLTKYDIPIPDVEILDLVYHPRFGDWYVKTKSAGWMWFDELNHDWKTCKEPSLS